MSSSPTVVNPPLDGAATAPAVQPAEVPGVIDPPEPPTATNNATETETTANKDQRKRFKKLRKRASKISDRLSGIVQPEEWLEVKQTLQEQQEDKASNGNDDSLAVFAPWIGMRPSKINEPQDKVREGVDHRLALKYLVLLSQQQSTSANKNPKRPREESPNKNNTSNIQLPLWMALHNPACVDHLAVLEIHLQGGKKNNSISIQDIEAIIPKNDETTVTPSSSAISTRWFEGPRPQSISDVLLYDKPAQSSKKKKKSKPSDENNSVAKTEEESAVELMETLQSMALTQEELRNEGYPIPVSMMEEGERPDNAIDDNKNGTDNAQMKEFRKPTSFSLEEAKAIVAACQVKVADEKFPFVMSRNSANLSAAGGTNDGIDNKSTSKCTRVFGLDCEMVKTKNGLEVGIVTLIEYFYTSNAASFQERYKILMNELVLPYAPILDYVTEYSGITAQMLKNVTTRLEQVQASVLSYMDGQNDILVGHSLENDLMAMRWVHCNVIDTAVVFRTKASFKHSLRHLSLNLLKRKIQGGNHHCSEEDAATTLELAIRRAEEGTSFGLVPNAKQWWIPTERNANENACVFVGPSQWLQGYVTSHANAIHALTCEDMDSPNRKAILSWLTGPKRRANLVWANLNVRTSDHLKILQELLLDLKTKMSSSTVLMVNVQSGHANANDNSNRRRLCQNPRTASTWSAEDEETYTALVDDSRSGRVWWLTNRQGTS